MVKSTQISIFLKKVVADSINYKNRYKFTSTKYLRPPINLVPKYVLMNGVPLFNLRCFDE